MSVTVPILTTKHFDFTGLNNILAYEPNFIKSHEDPSDLYVGFCGDCHVVNTLPVGWQTYFSVCLGAS